MPAPIGVPVIMAAGDSAFVEQFTRTVKVEAVATKYATRRSGALFTPDRPRTPGGRDGAGVSGGASAKPWVIAKSNT